MGRGRSRKRSSSGSASRESTPEPTKKCRNCGRQFAVSRLDKHEKICKKTSKRGNKVFDSGKQRSKGSDISYNNIEKARKQSVGPPKTSWRARHEDFQKIVKSAKGGGGGERARTPPDYVKCDHCGRKFNGKAAERHIPYCKSKNEKENEERGGGARGRGSSNDRKGAGSRDRKGGGSKDRKGSRDRKSGSSPRKGGSSPRKGGSSDRKGGSSDRKGGSSSRNGGSSSRKRDGSKSRGDSKSRSSKNESGSRRSNSRSRR